MDSAADGQQRPAFPGLASQASSASQSSSSLSTLASPPVFAVTGVASQQAQLPSGAPIPPSSPAPPSNSYGSRPHGNLATAAQTVHIQRAPPQLSRAASMDYQPNREGAGRTAQETATYLNEYSLVAEAAKRAQMAVLMRDMEGVELS